MPNCFLIWHIEPRSQLLALTIPRCYVGAGECAAKRLETRDGAETCAGKWVGAEFLSALILACAYARVPQKKSPLIWLCACECHWRGTHLTSAPPPLATLYLWLLYILLAQVVIKCLLVHTNPESALNEEAGRLLQASFCLQL